MPDWPNCPARSRFLPVNGLRMHFLDAGPTTPSTPLLVLLHGFPQLSYAWRRTIPALASAGYRVVAPDQRGYGPTASASTPPEGRISYADDMTPYRMHNVVGDVVALVYALGYREVYALIGHDMGSRVAACCAMLRPDMFKSVVLMSAPFPGPPSLPFAISEEADSARAEPPPPTTVLQMTPAFAALDPPRKHYTVYYSSPQATRDMDEPEQGMHAFFRDYFHAKSADSSAHTTPRVLPSLSAKGMEPLPHYYLMPLSESMPQVVRHTSPSASDVKRLSSRWLPDEELAVYASEFARTGFQGGFNHYRAMTDDAYNAANLAVFAGMRITQPAIFVSGNMDWGMHQSPGALERMKTCCVRMSEMGMGERGEGVVVVEGAGHWVQEEKVEEVNEVLLEFLNKVQGMVA